MSDRWIPILAALIGLLGGVGGGFVGGWVANEGQQQQFENEQAERAQDLRRSAFADFMQDAADVEFTSSAKDIDRLIGAEAKVGLFANPDVRLAAHVLVDVVDGPPYPKEIADCGKANQQAASGKTVDETHCYLAAQGEFVDAANAEVERAR